MKTTTSVHPSFLPGAPAQLFSVAIVSSARRLPDMKLPPVDLRRGDCHELEALLSEHIYEFNSKATGYFDGESFGAVQQDDSGAVLGGICGYTWGGCCYVSYLWVAEEHRGRGVGSALLQAAETNAKDKGCTVAMVSSHSFQAPGFYARLGYQKQASIKDHPVGHSSVFFAKRLAENGA